MAENSENTLSEQDSALLTAAILTAVSQGDDEAAGKLASLARDPEGLRELLDSVPPPGGDDSSPQPGKGVPPSPFRDRKRP